MSSAKHLGQIETHVLKAFGWAIVELEITLFHRFLQLSSRHSLTTAAEFRAIVLEMEAKGYLRSVRVQGRRAFQRLLIESSIEPQNPLDEMKLALGARATKTNMEKAFPSKLNQRVVVSSRMEGLKISSLLQKWLLQGRLPCIADKRLVKRYIRNLWQSLRTGDVSSLQWMMSRDPEVEKKLYDILTEKGDQYLLLSLRLLEIHN